jgi:hypothetical protein
MMGADNTNDATPMVTFSFGPENFSGFLQDKDKTNKAERRTIPKTLLFYTARARLPLFKVYVDEQAFI